MMTTWAPSALRVAAWVPAMVMRTLGSSPPRITTGAGWLVGTLGTVMPKIPTSTPPTFLRIEGLIQVSRAG